MEETLRSPDNHSHRVHENWVPRKWAGSEGPTVRVLRSTRHHRMANDDEAADGLAAKLAAARDAHAALLPDDLMRPKLERLLVTVAPMLQRPRQDRGLPQAARQQEDARGAAHPEGEAAGG